MIGRSETARLFIGRPCAPRRALVLLLVLFVTAGAQAQITAQTWFYRVTGVIAGDMLDVRYRSGEPFPAIGMAVDLARDFGIEAVSRYDAPMADSIAAIGQPALVVSSGDSPHLFVERAFSCLRGKPGPTGSCR